MPNQESKAQEALEYHLKPRPGKIEVVPTKPTNTQRDLALAYSPGVAEPCKEIHQDKENVYKYTSKANLVAVISNGTAVLGLGDIGPEASKPVMEGKGVLFKIFADIDVFDLEVDANDVDKFVSVVKALEPTFGGINLEDIKAPECFEIEKQLKESMNIPVMHDDQHGTAIIASAALLNALEIAQKDIKDIKLVVSGAGASAISCTNLMLHLGVRRENVIMLDKTGVIRRDRDDLDKYKQEFVTDRDLHTLDDAIEGADVFVGLSAPGVLKPDMLKKMADNPIVFALANPVPEIDYDVATKMRSDIIMATGRSDHPNQVNNVLGFPFIFRGALDVRATEINDEMKLAAAHAIAELAKKTVPSVVNLAYNQEDITFGKDYIIPKPIDPRLITMVAPAVAKAAMKTGVAKYKITNWEAYDLELKKRLGLDNKLVRGLLNKARKERKRVVFAEADNVNILKAAQIAYDEGYATPILLGNKDKIKDMIERHHILLPENTEIINPSEMTEQLQKFGHQYFEKRQRKGAVLSESIKMMKLRTYYGTYMVENGEADALVSGLTRRYADTLRPALQIVGMRPNVEKLVGMYIMMTKRGPIFFADTTVNVDPSVDDLVNIAELTASTVRQFDIEPRIAMLSYSNFGSSKGESPAKVAKATAILKEKYPNLTIDGEVQANVALDSQLQSQFFPFSNIKDGDVNTLIFPNLSAGNISYKLLQALGITEAIGPVVLGMNKSIHVLPIGSSVRDISNMVALAVVDAQNKSPKSLI